MRRLILALALAAMAAPAMALEPGDLAGDWTTEWADAPDQALSGGGPLEILRGESPDALDGHTPAPGLDGVMNGEVVEKDGALVWSGVWASVGRDWLTRGTFRFVFTDSDHFTGTWSTDDGEVTGAAWVGRRSAP